MPHISDDTLELFALGRLQKDAQVSRVEEHLLLCEYCQKALSRIDREISVIRLALGKFTSQNQRQKREKGKSLLLTVV
jgi:hypothetical protein